MATEPLAIVPSDAENGHAVAPLVRLSDHAPTLEGLIGQWLHAKGQRSQSVRTLEEYATVLVDFRAELQRAGLDLDAPQVQALGRLVQAWAARPRSRDGRPVSAATHNRRLAIVSSFYTFGKRHGGVTTAGVPLANPVDLVERARVQAYAAARPLDFADVALRLEAIDRSTQAGRRDYALLSVALATGRRLSELAALRWEHVALGGQGRATLTFVRTKGNKVMRDLLSVQVTDALLVWLAAAYGLETAVTAAGGTVTTTLAPDVPLWFGLGRNVPAGQRRPLSTDSIADICARRLGVSKVHALRHTTAVGLEHLGAKLTDIQAQLGHSNASTTSVYLQRLHDGENAFADDLAALFGIQGSGSSSPRAAAHVTTRPPLGRQRSVRKGQDD